MEESLGAVTEALAAIKSRGAFAAEQACPSDGLKIEVKSAGVIRFPISTAAVRALCAIAQPAPYGRRDKTLNDRSVRDTWEIGSGRIKVDARAWRRTLEPALAKLREKLGLPNDGKLVAVLDKMLIYTPGQFFAAHQDSERADDMVGSLVVQLPTASSGGTVIVHHHDEKKTFRGAKRGPKDLSLLAFYADCHHEVKPVVSGHRVVLTYHLLHHPATTSRAPAPQSPSSSAGVDRLVDKVRAYFATPVAHAHGNPTAERPDRLIYLLDHEYTERSLAWTRLKNGDRVRADALRQVAERLDCEIYLALADVHENWTCEENEWDYHGSRGGRYHRVEIDDDDSDNAVQPALGDLCDTSVELRHWVGHDGHKTSSVPVTPTQREICFTKASVDLNPFKSEHEGYMGNYGNTVDRWYHRAALVMWPRDRNFVIRAKVSPSWAANELAARIKARTLCEARDGARSLLPFWAQHAPREESHLFFAKLLKVALSLDDAALAHGLLAPFGPHRLSSTELPTFASIVERYGLAWSQQLFTAWSGHLRYGAPAWLPILPDLFQSLLSQAPGHGRDLADWLLTREVNAFEQARIAVLRLPVVWLGDEKAGEHSETLLALIEGAAAIQAQSTRDHLIGLLTTGPTALPILAAGALLQTCLKTNVPATTKAFGLHALYGHVVDAIERIIAAPPRKTDNWSIEIPTRCRCELCLLLVEFLRDPTRVEHVWPLAAAPRQHIHDVIGTHGLPVTHVTTRRGRPYSLVLTKQKEIFDREAAWRKRQEDLLGWLKKQRPAFVDDHQPASGS